VLGSAAVRPDVASPVRRLFTKQQRALFSDNVPDGVQLDDLSVLGAINVLKLKFSPKGLSRRLVAERWTYLDGSLTLELWTKCEATEASEVAAEARALLVGRGIQLSAEQQTKTRKPRPELEAEAD
jgi:hypothetical protein